MTLEEWRKKRGLSYTALAELLVAGNAGVVRKWCLPRDHKDSVVPNDENMMVIQQTTLGAVTQQAWVGGQNGVMSSKANHGGRNGRQQQGQGGESHQSNNEGSGGAIGSGREPA